MDKRQPNTERAETLRRDRTRLLLAAARTAIEAFRDVVQRDCERALATLDGVEPWAAGGEAPALFAHYREIARLVHGPGSLGEQTAEHLRAQVEYEALCAHRFSVCEIGVSVVLAQAANAYANTIDLSLKCLREAAESTCGDSASGSAEVVSALNALLGDDAEQRAELDRPLSQLAAVVAR